MKNSEIYVEKMEHVPGIYIIFNLLTHKMYIGKAMRLKERALQHIKNLYLGKDSKDLQLEFSKGKNKYYLGCLHQLESAKDLDKWESIYYQAAYNLYKKDGLYNIRELSSNQDKEIEKATSIIQNALARKTKGTERYSLNNFSKMKDWVDPNVLEKHKFQQKSIRQMFENNEIDYLLFGKAGDYCYMDGRKKVPQTVSEILDDKAQELENAQNNNTAGKCLWATAGPNMYNFQQFITFYKNKYKKPLYVLFKLTISRYEQKSETVEYHYQKNGTKYICTAPDRKTAKALLITKFYTIEEDFDFELFQNMYYKYEKPAFYKLENYKGYKLNSNNLSRVTLYPAVSKKAILGEANNDLREALGFTENPYLLDELKSDNNMINFPVCANGQHPVYYILAEVENYVFLKKNI